MIKSFGLMLSFLLVSSSALAEGPAEMYAHRSVGMTLGTGVSGIINGRDSNLSTLSGAQVNLFDVYEHLYVGTGMSVSYAPTIGLRDATMVNTLSFGVVSSFAKQTALTAKLNGGVLYSTSGRGPIMGSGTISLGVEQFLGEHAFMEVNAGGGFAAGGDVYKSQVLGLVGGGYSLGLLF